METNWTTHQTCLKTCLLSQHMMLIMLLNTRHLDRNMQSGLFLFGSYNDNWEMKPNQIWGGIKFKGFATFIITKNIFYNLMCLKTIVPAYIHKLHCKLLWLEWQLVICGQKHSSLVCCGNITKFFVVDGVCSIQSEIFTRLCCTHLS